MPTLTPDQQQLALRLLVALAFLLVGIFTPAIFLAGGLKFLRQDEEHDRRLGRIIAFTIAALLLASALFKLGR